MDHGVQQLMAQASAAFRAQDFGRAIALLQEATRIAPLNAAPLNLLGVVLMASGRSGEAVSVLRRAVGADPAGAPLHLNLATALENVGEHDQALASLDSALQCDPYLLAALVRKARLQEQMGRLDDALRTYRGLFQALPKSAGLPKEFDEALEHGRELVNKEGRERRERLDHIPGLPQRATSPGARAYLDQICGLRKVYACEPTGPHFPFLPAFEYFERDAMPWLAELEQHWEAIRDEFLNLWRDEAEGFQPYVQFDPTQPVNQWRELNRSDRWNAFFLWNNGAKNEENCARCPKTVQVLERLPMCDVDGKAPAVMFSVLAPRTRIPPHTGTTNTRAIVHLPLIVPDGCGFRVGGETREWVPGVAWAFDDTIEHEAWNDSEEPRVILILDAWNPLLNSDDRDVVRLAAPEIRT
jgi:aspartyl/asparaginyl beta-hydroxylase (cupin superfamily)/Tfp pilus assembly protein PilF